MLSDHVVSVCCMNYNILIMQPLQSLICDVEA